MSKEEFTLLIYMRSGIRHSIQVTKKIALEFANSMAHDKNQIISFNDVDYFVKNSIESYHVLPSGLDKIK